MRSRILPRVPVDGNIFCWGRSRQPRREEHTLVLLRHGLSTWNRENRFTGWCDVPLTEEGVVDAEEAGRLLKLRGYTFDFAFTSNLRRAYDTCEQVLAHTSKSGTKCIRSSHLNERHYGSLQGLRKDDPKLLQKYGEPPGALYGISDIFARTIARITNTRSPHTGEAHVFEWRKSYERRPPPIDPGHGSYKPPPAPLTESLKDCEERVVGYYYAEIAPLIKSGAHVRHRTRPALFWFPGLHGCL